MPDFLSLYDNRSLYGAPSVERQKTELHRTKKNVLINPFLIKIKVFTNVERLILCIIIYDLCECLLGVPSSSHAGADEMTTTVKGKAIGCCSSSSQ